MWVKQKAAGESIANDDFWFHHGFGTAIRNELRRVMRDEELPPITYHGEAMYNWDDYYRGVLDEMIEQAVVAYKTAEAA